MITEISLFFKLGRPTGTELRNKYRRMGVNRASVKR